MTLTQTAILTKKFLLFSFIFIVVFLIAWLSWRYYYYNIYLPSLPLVEILPDTKYGILPKPNLAQNNLSSSNYSYVLNTLTGDLPSDIPKIMRVFFAPQLGTTFLALDRAKELASEFGFLIEPEIAAPNQYRFLDGEGGELIIDLSTGNFKYQRFIATSAPALKALPNETEIAQNFKNFLANKKILRDELREGKIKVVFENNSPEGQSLASVSLWQSNIENLPVVTPLFNKGLINATLTSEESELKQYPKMEYIYWPVDLNNFSTYPIKTVEEAFEDLKEGSASVVIEPSMPEVSITSVYLAYLLSESYTPYIQPVFVFEGEGFAALSPAINDNWISK